MKARNKILLLALCMAALIAVSVLGTMAYLTSTDTVTNTFTVGKVAITLDEAKVNTAGEKLYVPANDNEDAEGYNGYVTSKTEGAKEA
ncbi:MAG: SipW-dependent-type signal peptide-containing protein, partial [Clostridiales bacterium]|nr:SipW-dependent-type signal peptide-containing protein [Clostridiales bacterium]